MLPVEKRLFAPDEQIDKAGDWVRGVDEKGLVECAEHREVVVSWFEGHVEDGGCADVEAALCGDMEGNVTLLSVSVLIDGF